MENRNATVPKTPFNSSNVVTCTLKEVLGVGESRIPSFLVSFGVSPLLSLRPHYQAQESVD